MDFKVVIPARYSSVRLPGKPLREIAGRPMIQHVYERARESGADEVVIATDDERIRQTAKAFGAEVCMTAAHHRSGSDRIAEVVEQLRWAADAIVVNLQGDEPTMPASLIDQVAADMQSHELAGVTTLSAPIESHEMLFDPHVVKVVTDIEGYALYFSRAPIPWHRDEFLEGRESLPSTVAFSRHIGLYAYRAGYLKQFVSWAHAPLEQAESLEQLRVLWHGGKIHVSQATEAAGHGVDTEDDLKRVDEVLSR
ncbi:MAG: 3-deoxy-manno-octulosonate cytidylyltransferase [gamma proteobacterium endosymbiont of Lamellibrachia anaximandri]|nr:3-deoxy-manno-octulosonate cytidylyltransferase [gamma proteobacterium endosymbiont of Lamellibrachia anaximandri]MBL3532460.1 3-deoxy-manno-octulosonate cytidylyltransferase [gamma proteobacterium endosymbiont of Lamellibrachia anaximandri]MBL3600446.1 3-deoxy-manno-octulosonate cytidylyltransferase [gamma proteobacterium endosymbiont of Lamellibrachia anaximandri]